MVTVIEDAGSGVPSWSPHGLAVTARWEQEPTRDEVRAALRNLDEDGVLVAGTAATLNVVVDGLRRAGALATPVAFLPGVPAKHAPEPVVTATFNLSQQFTLPGSVEEALAAEPVALPLTRNDIGGVLLDQCHFERARLARFGAQTYHDDHLISDGPMRGLSILPEYDGDLTLRAIVTPASGRKRTTTTYGRAVQIACEPVRMWVDGRDGGEVAGRTWYVDDREEWLLRGARRGPQDGGGGPAQPSGFWQRLLSR